MEERSSGTSELLSDKPAVFLQIVVDKSSSHHLFRVCQKPVEGVEKLGLGTDLFAVTIPCCAKER